MNLPHHRHHPPGRDLEWLLPITVVASAIAMVVLVGFGLRNLPW